MPLARAIPFAAALLVVACGLARADDFTLDDLRVAAPDGNAFSAPHVSFVGSNLSQDDARRLFAADTAPDARDALLRRLAASKILIPDLVLSSDEGQADLFGLEADGVADGKAAKVTIKSGHMTARLRTGGSMTADLNAFALEGLDLSSVIAPGRKLAPRMDHAVFEGFLAHLHGSDRKVFKQDATMSLGRAEVRNSYAGGVLVKTSTRLDSLQLRPDGPGEFAQAMKAWGRDGLSVDMTEDASYDPGTHVFTLNDLTIDQKGFGRLSLNASFLGFTPGMAGAQGAAALKALSDLRVSSLSLRFDDDGLMNGVLSLAAARHESRDAARLRLSSEAALMLPILTHGDPAGLALAEALSSFIQSPGDLDVTMTAKSKDQAQPLLGLAGLFERGAISKSYRVEAKLAAGTSAEGK